MSTVCVYQVIDHLGRSKGIYHENINAAIMFFLMNGNRGAYLGNMTNDWDNYKLAGARVAEYVLQEIKE